MSRRIARGSLSLYAIAFLLPIPNGHSGLGAFFMSLLFFPAEPQLIVYWMANPMYWFCLVRLRRGRLGSAAIAGTIAAFCAAMPIVWGVEHQRISTATGIPDGLGYFVWAASIGGLAAWATFEAASEGLATPRQLRLRTLMILIAAIAAALAALPVEIAVLRWLTSPFRGGWNMG